MAIEVLGSGQPDGTAVVKSTSEKIHLYGGTAVTQAATIADAVAATGTTATNTGTSATCSASNADHALLVTIINTLLDDLSDLGAHASA